MGYKNLEVRVFQCGRDHPCVVYRGKWGWKLISEEGICVDSFIGYSSEADATDEGNVHKNRWEGTYYPEEY